MIGTFKHLTPKAFVRNGAILFTVSIACAYVLYPHWVTFSLFAGQWYTLPFFIVAMLITMLQLWYISAKLRQQVQLRFGGTVMRASAICVILVICIPYRGGLTQKSIHNAAVLLFVLLAALSLIRLAKPLHSITLGVMSGALVALCVLELVFLARYNMHPVYPWVWVVLQVIVTAILMLALYVIALRLEQKSTS